MFWLIIAPVQVIELPAACFTVLSYIMAKTHYNMSHNLACTIMPTSCLCLARESSLWTLIKFEWQRSIKIDGIRQIIVKCNMTQKKKLLIVSNLILTIYLSLVFCMWAKFYLCLCLSITLLTWVLVCWIRATTSTEKTSMLRWVLS